VKNCFGPQGLFRWAEYWVAHPPQELENQAAHFLAEKRLKPRENERRGGGGERMVIGGGRSGSTPAVLPLVKKNVEISTGGFTLMIIC